MKQQTSQKPWSSQYDLSIANMHRWRELRAWTPEQTKRWTEMRARGEKTPLPSSDDIFVKLARYGDRLFWTAVAAAGTGLLFIGYQVLVAVASGRVHEVLDAITRSH
jgi:hypothetical protein